VLSNLDGIHWDLEWSSCRFVGQVLQVCKALGEDHLPVIRYHDLRHTHATGLVSDGVAGKVASERLGDSSATITLTVYQHVHPGMGRRSLRRAGLDC
jgi:integrase